MTCQDARGLLHPYSDGELDLVRHVEVEGHIAGCAECGARADDLRSLRAALASPTLQYRAPAALRDRVRLAAFPGAEPEVRGRRRFRLRSAPIAAAASLLVGATVTLAILSSRGGISAEGRLADQVIAGHVRSLQIDHLTDVASSDRHTVKPWFAGKLDFAPQAPDLSSEGFPLKGGRLDYLDDRPVAALVYYRRRHSINLFTWPTAAGPEQQPVRALARQGFHVRHWRHSGMTYWAISDLNDEELDAFAREFRRRSAEPHTSGDGN